MQNCDQNLQDMIIYGITMRTHDDMVANGAKDFSSFEPYARIAPGYDAGATDLARRLVHGVLC